MLCLLPSSLKRRAPNDLLSHRSRSPPAQRVLPPARSDYASGWLALRQCRSSQPRTDVLASSQSSIRAQGAIGRAPLFTATGVNRLETNVSAGTRSPFVSRRSGWKTLDWFRALMPKEDRFFGLFERHASLVVAGAGSLRVALQGGPAERGCRNIEDCPFGALPCRASAASLRYPYDRNLRHQTGEQ